MNKFSVVKVWIAFSAVFILIFGYSGSSALGLEVEINIPFQVEIPSSFDPVGSGARAIGRGGAFIAVADDATAASWNPGGLTQLKKPETSVVFSGFNRKEDIEFGLHPEGNGLHSVSDTNINYLSATYPFELLNRNMVVSLSYQHLYDFTREWKNYMLKYGGIYEKGEIYKNYQQDGQLSAIGLSYCIRIIPQLSLGVTFNFWNDDISPNHWEQKYSQKLYGVQTFDNNPKPVSSSSAHTESYVFKGFNANLGILWRLNYNITVGAVLKTPFVADVEHRIDRTYYSDLAETERLKMPMSYGIGIAYNFSDYLSISGDIYKTEWNHYTSEDNEGNEISPLSNLPISQSDISPTYQLRVGGEYLFIEKEKGYIIPLRAGIFYDPAPANGSPDNFYGFSIGTGFTNNNRFSLDIAYQYRFGNNAGEYILPDIRFSQDVIEHTVYISAIFYKF